MCVIYIVLLSFLKFKHSMFTNYCQRLISKSKKYKKEKKSLNCLSNHEPCLLHLVLKTLVIMRSPDYMKYVGRTIASVDMDPDRIGIFHMQDEGRN